MPQAYTIRKGPLCKKTHEWHTLFITTGISTYWHAYWKWSCSWCKFKCSLIPTPMLNSLAGTLTVWLPESTDVALLFWEGTATFYSIFCFVANVVLLFCDYFVYLIGCNPFNNPSKIIWQEGIECGVTTHWVWKALNVNCEKVLAFPIIQKILVVVVIYFMASTTLAS